MSLAVERSPMAPAKSVGVPRLGRSVKLVMARKKSGLLRRREGEHGISHSERAGDLVLDQSPIGHLGMVGKSDREQSKSEATEI